MGSVLEALSETEREGHEVAAVVAGRPDPELCGGGHDCWEIRRHGGDGQQASRLAVSRTDDQLEGLLVVGRGDDLVVEPASTNYCAGSEARSWPENAAAAAHRDQGTGQMGARRLIPPGLRQSLRRLPHRIDCPRARGRPSDAGGRPMRTRPARDRRSHRRGRQQRDVQQHTRGNPARTEERAMARTDRQTIR